MSQPVPRLSLWGVQESPKKLRTYYESAPVPEPVVPPKEEPTAPPAATLEAGTWEIVPVTAEPDKRAPKRPVKKKVEVSRIEVDKVRKSLLGISVSREEVALFHDHAFSQGMSFSAWARGVLVQAAGLDTPSRVGIREKGKKNAPGSR